MVKLFISYKKVWQICTFSSNVMGTPLLPSKLSPSHQNAYNIRLKVSKSEKYSDYYIILQSPPLIWDPY